jgi:uncharacterized protein (DUF433 family)
LYQTGLLNAWETTGDSPSEMRVTVGTIVGLMASRHSPEEILKVYPYLEIDDIYQALAYAAWRTQEIEVPLALS